MKYAIIVLIALVFAGPVLLAGCSVKTALDQYEARVAACPYTARRVTEVLDMRECVKEKVCHISAQEYAEAAAVIRACPEKFR